MSGSSWTHRRAELSLIVVVAVWGWAFVAVKEAIERIPLLTFLSLRFSLAFLVFLPLLRRGKGSGNATRSAWIPGLLCGTILALGYALQTLGLAETSSGRSGVITGISVALVPIGIGIFFRQRIRQLEWTGVVLALIGFGILGTGDAPLNWGDLLVLGCAVAFAGHIIALDRWAKGRSAVELAATQVGTAAAVFLALALWHDGLDGFTAIDRSTAIAIAVTGIVATTWGFTVQTRAQQHVSATRIALIVALEPVFALIAGAVLRDEGLGPSAWIGGGCVLAGMLCAELGPRK